MATEVVATIAVDVGNSAVKMAAVPGTLQPTRSSRLQFQNPTVIQCADAGSEGVPSEFSDFVRGLPGGLSRWCVVSVNHSIESRLAGWVRQLLPRSDYRCLRHSDLPVRLNVLAPEQVGMDRLSAAAAADELRPSNRSAIVVDAGTAITVDLISSDGTFQGGAILPGLATSASALALAAEALPRIGLSTLSGSTPAIGKSTEQAIASGIMWGCVGAVKELVQQMTSTLDDEPFIFCTGGDGQRISQALNRDVTLDEHLVLRGALLCAVA